MQYEVPGVQLMVQDQNMACWFASAMMVINWAERFRPTGNASVMPDDETMNIYKANTGLQNFQIIPLARRLGLVAVPPQSPSIMGLNNWFLNFGPLWTNGKNHIVVLAGVRGDDARGYEVKVYDPWPGNGVEWRTLAGWYTGFNPGARGASSRDVSRGVEAVFLHAP